MSKPIRLRPFREHLERERHLPLLEVAGRIDGKRFIVSALGHEIVLDAIEFGEDGHGPYALVKEGEHALPNGFKVRVEPEPDEHLPPGGVITLAFRGDAGEGVVELLRAQGLDPASVILLGADDRSFSVYFDSAGLVNGRAASYADDGREPTLN